MMLCLTLMTASLWAGFANPPHEAKPWAYHWWTNGNVDRETITADLQSMKSLGFGGVNMIDSRGYWDNSPKHVPVPPVDIQWGTERWYDMVAFEIRECARLGLEFTMNAACSGGTMSRIIDGKFVETEIMDRQAVIRHLDEVLGPLFRRCPDLVGTTFTHIYSVSYEGNKAGGSWKAVKDTFYATMAKWAHEHGLKVYSESGGPWAWGAEGVKLDCSQLDMLAHNDFPQGEFWAEQEYANGDPSKVAHANQNGSWFQRGIVLAARQKGVKIVSMEAFTHMLAHYSVDPKLLKPLADVAFADGATRMVWHTFSCSPKKFGVPGIEYFAGSHINRNVTWQKDAADFVNYLGRCSYLLQQGDYVDDGEFANVQTNYYHYHSARYRKDPQPQFTTSHRRVGNTDLFFVAGEGKGELTLACRADGRRTELWDAVTCSRRQLEATACGERLKVTLDLPTGGSCFVVVGEDGSTRETSDKWQRTPVEGPWHVSFKYHEGVAATPPPSRTMASLSDWTTCEDEGAASTSLRYFSGTGIYRNRFRLSGRSSAERVVLSLGRVPTGLARVFVNGVDCGVVWCEPFEVDVTAATKEDNELEIRYTNNWMNRLVGDCRLPAERRVTKSNLRYHNERTGDASRNWECDPTPWSGPAANDRLQPSGLLGPIELKRPVSCQ